MTTRKKKPTVTQVIPTPTPEKKKVNLKDPQGMKVSVPDNMVINKREDYTNLSIEDDSDDFLLYNMKTYIKECSEWGSNIQVSKWANETGFEIIHQNKNGAFQHLSIAKEEAQLLIKMINKMIDR
ncbi:MAG TPA: hypothetical protein PLD95_02410 [bacterium]|jgi:hypothetical protein|nr:MAG: hypothetical protein BWX59_00811 [Bacteroidetes bacterium ADurb.Bin028]HOG38303.1 hypothetical protein [bacterium]